MHSVIALRYGIRVRQIILFIFGGVSEIPEETRDFRKEFKIAIARPAASFAIAGALAVSCLGRLHPKLLLLTNMY
jgi:Zn-dependent protease